MRFYGSIFTRCGLTLQVLKTALAAAASWYAATHLSQNEYPYFAPLAAVLTLQVTIADSLEKAVQRISGVIGGVVVSVFIGHWLSINTVSILLVVLLGTAISTALHLGPPITSQVAVSALLVLAFGHGYAVSRIIETMVGSAIAIGINAFFVPPDAVPAAERQFLELNRQSAATLHNLAEVWRRSDVDIDENLAVARQLVGHTAKSLNAVKLAEQSLRFNPFLTKRRTRIARVAGGLNRMEHINIQVRGIARGLADLCHTAELTAEQSQLAGLAPAVQATAACIAGFGETILTPSVGASAGLMKSVTFARECQTLLLGNLKQLPSLPFMRDIGGVLTDLNRILHEVRQDDEPA